MVTLVLDEETSATEAAGVVSTEVDPEVRAVAATLAKTVGGAESAAEAAHRLRPKWS